MTKLEKTGMPIISEDTEQLELPRSANGNIKMAQPLWKII
jgi:hypothetical protein